MKKRAISPTEPYPMCSEVDAAIDEMTEQADADIEEMRVNMRWGAAQVAVVKRAAALFGMPYQSYVKQAAFRQAIADLQAVEAVLGLGNHKAKGSGAKLKRTSAG